MVFHNLKVFFERLWLGTIKNTKDNQRPEY